jgi:hypothetical protein
MVEIQARGGSSLAGYQLGECLGHSTHTAVYKASGQMGSQWAFKVIDQALDPDARVAERLKREAELLSRLDHPSIPPIYETARTEQVTFATVPLLDASSLADLMARGEMDLELAWSVLNQIADALDRAHRLGLSHRLLKPSNVLLDGAGRAYLAEFGVASQRLGPTALNAPRYDLRFAQYLAPEQVEGREPDGRTDVYAAGVLVFEILTGKPLFEGASVPEVLRQTLHSPVPSAHSRRWGLPREVDTVLGRALSKDPRERQRTAYELIEDLIALPEPEAGMAEAPPEQATATRFSIGPLNAPAPESALATLHRMGVPTFECHNLPVLNSYFACVIQHTKEVAGSQAAKLLELAGLEKYILVDPPSDGKREGTVEQFSRLADAFELVYGNDAPTQLNHLGRAVTEDWMRTTQPKPFRMMGKAESKVSDTLYMFNSSMDRVRGEELHAWKQIDKGQFWVVHYGNLFAVGRRKPAKSCHFWVSAFEAALRWGGLANDWVVEETECGCVTGVGACVFTLERIGSY